MGSMQMPRSGVVVSSETNCCQQSVSSSVTNGWIPRGCHEHCCGITLIMISQETETIRVCMWGVIRKAGKSKICLMGWQAREQGRANVAVQVQRLSTSKISSCSVRSVFCSIQTISLLKKAYPHYGGQSALHPQN